MTAIVAHPSDHAALPAYKQVDETKYDLDWADLVTLDLSKFDQPGGKEALAKQLFDAIQNIGFFYVINFELTQEEVDRQFAIGKSFFELSTEEKLKYRADLANGGYNGYKPLRLREIKPGIFDNIEIYNILKFILELERPQPGVINEHKVEIERFARQIHSNIALQLLTLFAIILELPEDHFTKSHRYDEAVSDCHLRYMKSLTLLFRQPVAALQVLTPNGNWKWVKPYDGSITVNVADALQFLTNGFLKSSVHRVVAPPPDQAGITRLGVLYFVRPENDLELKPVESSVLERLGYKPDESSQLGAGITAGEWVKARVKAGVDRGEKARSEVSEQEIVKGVKAKYYD
ncbi:hypothetical protein NCS52_01469700 [Fusarium sp. LHS14.1]|nr:hypothetical protein NCS52_01469700 [Fusarium sp. LHS14.1]